MYNGAVFSAVALRKPDEAFALAERGRSRAFLDLLGTQTVLSKGKTRALVDEEVRLRARLAAAKAAADEAGRTTPRTGARRPKRPSVAIASSSIGSARRISSRPRS